MRFLLLLLTGALVLYEAQSASERCVERIEECHTTNYEQYVNCIRRRQKRSVDCNSPCDSDNCIDTCNECDCDSCGYSSCQNSCDSCCSTCCNNYNVCTNNHCCHKTCHAQCRSSSCRSSCRKSCYERIREINNGSSNTNSSTTNDIRHNITTIIHLNNVINNTNIIDIPIVLNNTNHQNITLYEREHRRSNSSPDDNCCIVISPRQCVPQKEPPFVRCFHYRSRQCGAYCTAPIVHKEQKQVCETVYPGSAPNCSQSVLYIPQPQPRCTYQSTWPYVACGVSRTESCAGCYSHYADPSSQNYVSCPSACYDQGYGVSPYYRQGPYYRPTYSHVPCYSCFGYEGYGNGGYGAPYQAGYQPAGYPPYGSNAGSIPIVPYGSWSPEIDNNYYRNNNSDLSLDPLISVGPGLANPYIPEPYRVSRELEIEVNYEPKPMAQAEVKIKMSDKDEDLKDEEIDLNNSTETTSTQSKTLAEKLS